MAAEKSREKAQKDLTGIIEYAETLKQSGAAMPVPEGSVMEETPIEKIDDFESLEAYSASNPAPEIPPEAAFEDHPAPPSPATDSAEGLIPLESSQDSIPSGDFPITETPPENAAQDFGDFPVSDEAPSAEAGGFDFSSEPSANDFSPPITDSEIPVDPGIEPISELPPDSGAGVTAAAAVELPPLEDTRPPPFSPSPSPSLPEAPPESTMDKVKRYSENIQSAKPVVPAAFPFSLLIRGHLEPDEKEKFLEILSTENMGFREIELEPQLEMGKILLPRISEYAGIMIVQALRGARVDIRLGPSDTIFATEETRDEGNESGTSRRSQEQSSFVESGDLSHPAEQIPIVSTPYLPGNLPGSANTNSNGAVLCIPIDTITASASLKVRVVEAETSSEYQELVEALQREIRYKAYRKGADAVIYFTIRLDPLSSPTRYRVSCSGTAVKVLQGTSSSGPTGPVGTS